MNCETVNRMMQDYLDGDLPARNAATVENHVTVCARCNEELNLHLALIQLMESQPPHDPPPHLLPNIQARLPAIHPAARHVFTFRLASLIAFAAAWVALAALTFALARSGWCLTAVRWACENGATGTRPLIAISAVMLLGYAMGQLGTAWGVGRRWASRAAPSLTSQALMISVGVAVLAAICRVPGIGFAVCAALALLGFGALMTTGFHASPVWLWKHWRQRDRWGAICTMPRKSSGFSSTPPPETNHRGAQSTEGE